jgi:hypothetical protein
MDEGFLLPVPVDCGQAVLALALGAVIGLLHLPSLSDLSGLSHKSIVRFSYSYVQSSGTESRCQREFLLVDSVGFDDLGLGH